MNISATSSSADRSASLKAADTDPLAVALRRPAEALSKEVESTRVRLSAFGQVKSAVAEVQSSARALQDSKQLQSAESARKVAESFVKAYNTETRTIATLTRREASRAPAGALADDSRARSASSDLQRAVRNSESLLKQAGVTQQKDGTLAIDAKVFEAAYVKDSGSLRQSLSTAGNRIEAVATRQLSASGPVGSAVSNLSNKVANLEDRQVNVQALLDESKRAVQEQVDRFKPGPFATGVSAYKGIFSI